MAREFQSGLEEVAREAELDKVSETVKTATDPVGRVRREIMESVDPDGDINEAMNFDTDWTDDDLVDYDAPEFAEENKIASPGQKKPPQDKPEANTDKQAEGQNEPEKPA